MIICLIVNPMKNVNYEILYSVDFLYKHVFLQRFTNACSILMFTFVKH